MIVQTNNTGNAIHTFVRVGQMVYCHSNNGREELVFPAKHTGVSYEISSWQEVEDYRLVDKIANIVNLGI